jgi:hypothetical protein
LFGKWRRKRGEALKQEIRRFQAGLHVDGNPEQAVSGARQDLVVVVIGITQVADDCCLQHSIWDRH